MSDIVLSGELGQLINIIHEEPIGYFHFAHSYVRGNWAREADSCFSLNSSILSLKRVYS